MKKRLFMIAAIMTIVALIAVALVACKDDKNKDDGNKTEQPTVYTEVGGLKIDNLRTEIYNKSLKVNVIQKSTNADGVTETYIMSIDYEPYKGISKYKNSDGTEYTEYSYKLGEYFVSVSESMLNVSETSYLFSGFASLIAPNKDLYDFKDNVYTIKADKYNEYYGMVVDEGSDLPEGEQGQMFKDAFASMKIEFSDKAITIQYVVYPEGNGTKFEYKYVISDIGSTTVTIPQNIYDIPVHGINDLSDINNRLVNYNMNYTANIKQIINNQTIETIAKYSNTKYTQYIKGQEDKAEYTWYDSDTESYYKYALDTDGVYKKTTASFKDKYIISDMINEIIEDSYLFSESNGVYKVSETYIESYINRTDLELLYGSENMEAIKNFVRSIEVKIENKKITLSYEKNIGIINEKTTIEITDFYTSPINIPQNIIDMPLAG